MRVASIGAAVIALASLGCTGPPRAPPPPLENRSAPPPIKLESDCEPIASVAERARGGRLIELDMSPAGTALVVRKECVLSCRHEIYVVNGPCAHLVGVLYASHLERLDRVEHGLPSLRLAIRSAGSALEWEASFDGTEYVCDVERQCICPVKLGARCECEPWGLCAPDR